MTTQNDFYPYCFECGGDIVRTPPNGRTREIEKGVTVPIPETFLIPTCQNCGDELWAPELSTAIDESIGRVSK